MKKILAITGPTAVGKSDIAIEVAKALDGEIISADSMQIYRGLDVGTAKLTTEEMQGVRHHLINIVDPKDSFNVFEFREAADKCLADILSREKTPIVCGGTGLYLNAFLYEYRFRQDENDDGLKFCDLPSRYKHTLVVLNMDRKMLYERINNRVDKMMEGGLVSEVEWLYSQGLDENLQSMQAIGYKQIIGALKGEVNLEDTVEKIKQLSRNYAKRQLTWFRKMKDANWLEVENCDRQSIIKKVLKLYE